MIPDSEVLRSAAVFFGAYWEYAIIFLILIYLLFPSSKEEKQKRAWIIANALLAAVIARFGVATVIRIFYFKQRPFVLKEFEPLFEHAATASFPSGHAIFFMALAVVTLLAGRKNIGWFLFASAVLISIARVFAGIHWWSDVLSGWVLGAIVGLLVWWFLGKKRE